MGVNSDLFVLVKPGNVRVWVPLRTETATGVIIDCGLFMLALMMVGILDPLWSAEEAVTLRWRQWWRRLSDR